MPGDRRELRTDFVSRDVNTGRTLDEIERKADRAGDALDGMARDAHHLDSQLAETQGAIKELAREIDRTGDLSLVKKLQAEQRNLKKILNVKEILGSDEEQRREGDRVSRNVFGRIVARAGAAGAEAGATLSRALASSTAGLPQPVQAAIGAGVVAAVALAAPAVTAILSGAVLAGVGAAPIAGGVLIAARDPRVKRAGSELGATVMSGLSDAAAVLVEPVLRGIRILRDGFNDVLPDIREAFRSAAPYVDDLVMGVADFARNIMPGLNKAIERSGPILEMVGREIGELGTAFSNFFDDISEQSTGAQLGLQAFFDGVARLVEFTGKVLAVGSAIFEKYAMAYDLASGNIGGFVSILTSKNDDAKKSNEDAAGSFDLLTEAGRNYTGQAGFLTTAIDDVGSTITDAATKIQVWTGDMHEAIDAAGDLTTAMKILNGEAVDAREAESRVQEAIDNANESLKKHGATLKLNTAEGRANNDALMAVRDAYILKAQAAYNTKAAVGDLTGAERDSNAVLTEGRKKFIELADKMGLSATQAIALADEIFKIPANKNVKVTADTAKASSNVTTLQRQIRDLNGKTITITLKYREDRSGIHVSGGIGSGTQVKGSSMGGPIFGPGPKGVDSELRRVAPGEHIFTADEVDAMGGQAKVLEFRRNLHSAGAASAPAPASRRAPEARPADLARAVEVALERVLARATLRIDDRTAQFADLLARGG